MRASIKPDTSIPHSSFRVRTGNRAPVRKMAQGIPSWLSQDFAQEILRRHEADNSIEVIDMFTKPATNKGDNYTSDMYRIFFEIKRNSAGKKVTEQRSAVLKVAPTEDGPRKELMMKVDIFEVEINMMTKTLEKMNKAVGNNRRFNAKSLCVYHDYPKSLLFEDLAIKGFRMADRESGLDLKHCLQAIQNIGRFHASSVLVCEMEPAQKELYKNGMFSFDCSDEMIKFFVQGTHALARAVESWPELGQEYAEKISRIAPHIYERSRIAVQPKEGEFCVINHGDSWVNNMMFRYNDAGEPIDHIFVDFQLCIYTSPAVDLHYFLNTSPSAAITEEDREHLLQEYHQTLCKTMEQIGCTTQPPTMGELKKSLQERLQYSLLASFTVLPIVLIDKNEVQTIDEIFSPDKEYENPGYKGTTYRKIMSKRIPEYDKLGLFEA